MSEKHAQKATASGNQLLWCSRYLHKFATCKLDAAADGCIEQTPGMAASGYANGSSLQRCHSSIPSTNLNPPIHFVVEKLSIQHCGLAL